MAPSLQGKEPPQKPGRFTALTVTELEQLVGIEALPGGPSACARAALDLPVPHSQHVAGKKARSRSQGPETDEFSLGDLARRSLEKLLRNLAK